MGEYRMIADWLAEHWQMYCPDVLRCPIVDHGQEVGCRYSVMGLLMRGDSPVQRYGGLPWLDLPPAEAEALSMRLFHWGNRHGKEAAIYALREWEETGTMAPCAGAKGDRHYETLRWDGPCPRATDEEFGGLQPFVIPARDPVTTWNEAVRRRKA